MGIAVPGTELGSAAVGRAPGPAVQFGSARRPEEATQVVLDDWAGPLGLLLTLIEARRLDVMTVPLGALAGAYLEALATLDGDRNHERQLVRGRGEPADPHQEPGDASAPGRCGARRG